MSSFKSHIWQYPLSDGQYQRNHHDAVKKIKLSSATGRFCIEQAGMLTLELSSIVLEIPNDVHDRMRIGFCKILKIKCSQMKILILLSLCKISLHNR